MSVPGEREPKWVLVRERLWEIPQLPEAVQAELVAFLA
jgi:hypothetical protein